MNTKNVLLVGAGVLVGYLLAGYYLKSKSNPETTTGSTGSTSEQYPSANPPATTNPKIEACNKEVADFMATAKFSKAVMEQKKKELFDACMAKNA